MSALTFTDCENSLNSVKDFLTQFHENTTLTTDYDDAHFQVMAVTLKQISDLMYEIYMKDISIRKNELTKLKENMKD